MAWRLQGDLLALDGLRLRLHRIGLTHWRAGTTLRSWGAAPLHREGDDTLHVPCAPGEALWLGAWLDEEAASRASVHLAQDAPPAEAGLTVPQAFQLTGLLGRQGKAHPLTRADGATVAELQLRLQCAADHARIALVLQAPEAWAARAGRPAPSALAGPPPLPPRLG